MFPKNRKCLLKTRLRSKKCQILSDFELKFYHASDFELKTLPSVKFGKNKIFWKEWFWRKDISKNHDFEEKFFSKSRFWKKFCTQKITFWFYLHRKMWKLCSLRAILKSTTLEKKIFSEKHEFQWKTFCKKHDFETKNFRPVSFWNKNFSSCQMLNQLFHASDFKEEQFS